MNRFGSYYLGLDAGRHTIRLVCVRQRLGRTTLIGTAALPRDADPVATARQLRSLLHERGWSYFPCVYGFSSDLISTRILDIPPRGDAHLRQIAGHHIEEFEVLAGAPAVTEYAVMHSGGQRRMLLMTARVDTLLKELELPQAAGLQVADIVPTPIAAYYGAHWWASGSAVPTVLIHVGSEHTDWIIGHGSSLLHLRRIPIGGRLLAEETREASPMERRHFRQWVEDLEAARRAFDLQYESTAFRPERFGLLGAYPFSADEKAAVAQALDLPPLRWRDGHPASPEAWASAAGLARAGTGRHPIPLSLLPPDMKSAAELKRQIRYWLAASLALLATGGVITWHTHRALAQARHRRDLAQTQVDQLVRMEREWLTLTTANAQLRQRVMPLRSALRNNQAVTTLLHVLETAKGPDDWLVLMADHKTYFGDAGDPEATDARDSGDTVRGQTPRDTSIRRLVIEGYTPFDDLSTVRVMIERLRTYPFIEAVDLLPDDQVRPDWVAAVPAWQDKARRFALEIELAGSGL